MITVSLRRTGGSCTVSIPRTITKLLKLEIGARFKLSVSDNNIILTPTEDETTLEELLLDSPKECFSYTNEDKEWLHEKPVGRELI